MQGAPPMIPGAVPVPASMPPIVVTVGRRRVAANKVNLAYSGLVAAPPEQSIATVPVDLARGESLPFADLFLDAAAQNLQGTFTIYAWAGGIRVAAASVMGNVSAGDPFVLHAGAVGVDQWEAAFEPSLTGADARQICSFALVAYR